MRKKQLIKKQKRRRIWRSYISQGRFQLSPTCQLQTMEKNWLNRSHGFQRKCLSRLLDPGWSLGLWLIKTWLTTKSSLKLRKPGVFVYGSFATVGVVTYWLCIGGLKLSWGLNIGFLKKMLLQFGHSWLIIRKNFSHKGLNRQYESFTQFSHFSYESVKLTKLESLLKKLVQCWSQINHISVLM